MTAKAENSSEEIKPAIIFVLPFILAAAAYVLLPVQICMFKNVFGFECPGCGITRAVLEVLHGNFTSAWAFNKSVIIVFPLLVYIWLKESRPFYLKIFLSLKKRFGG